MINAPDARVRGHQLVRQLRDRELHRGKYRTPPPETQAAAHWQFPKHEAKGIAAKKRKRRKTKASSAVQSVNAISWPLSTKERKTGSRGVAEVAERERISCLEMNEI